MMTISFIIQRKYALLHTYGIKKGFTQIKSRDENFKYLHSVLKIISKTVVNQRFYEHQHT